MACGWTHTGYCSAAVVQGVLRRHQTIPCVLTVQQSPQDAVLEQCYAMLCYACYVCGAVRSADEHCIWTPLASVYRAL
jgi:hypothetical protein